MTSFKDTCYPQFGLIVQKITEGLGIEPYACIGYGAGGSSQCMSTNERSFGDNESCVGREFLCSGCRYVSRKHLEEDIEEWETQYEEAVLSGGKVEGAPTPRCNYKADWNFEYKDGKIQKPEPNQIFGKELWHIDFSMHFQKKIPYRLLLDIASDVNPQTDDCGFSMEMKKSRNGNKADSEGRDVEGIILRNFIDSIADDRVLEQPSIQEIVDIQKRFNDEYQTKKIQAKEIFSRPHVLEALRMIDDIKF